MCRATPSKMNPSSRLVSGWYWWRATSLSIHFIIFSWFQRQEAHALGELVGVRLEPVVVDDLEDHPHAAASSAVISSPVNR